MNLPHINGVAFWFVLSNVPATYLLGLLVQKNKLPAYLTRKIIHIFFFFGSFLLRVHLPSIYLLNYAPNLALFSILRFLFFMEPIRRHSEFLTTSFMCLDREEDRPYSFKLLMLQLLTQLFVINATYFFAPRFFWPRQFFAIAYLALVFGDGLAEPVGNWIKSKKYQTFSIFPTRGNFRTVAGSACVYVVTFLLICFYWPSTQPDFFLQLLIVPVVTTLLEAFSPKALDNPFIFLGTLVTLHLVHGGNILNFFRN